jgi:hypothetical protein
MTENQISIKLSQAGMNEVNVAIATLTMKPHPVLIDFESKGGQKIKSETVK